MICFLTGNTFRSPSCCYRTEDRGKQRSMSLLKPMCRDCHNTGEKFVENGADDVDVAFCHCEYGQRAEMWADEDAKDAYDVSRREERAIEYVLGK